MDSKIEIDELTLRKAINDIRNLIKNPNNGAAQAMARISANTLEAYLPEKIEEANTG